MQTFPEYIKEQQQRELLAKQAEEAAKPKEKPAKPTTERPSSKDARNEGSNNRAVQEKNGKSYN